MRQIGPEVGETPTPGQNPDYGELQLRLRLHAPDLDSSLSMTVSRFHQFSRRYL